jgi:hypothetical protein
MFHRHNSESIVFLIGGAGAAGATCGTQDGGMSGDPMGVMTPYLHGGNGGSAMGLPGGRGGGVVSVDVYGELKITTGAGITANGHPGQAAKDTSKGGGGGGGGTVEVIISKPIVGTGGIITAQGGDGNIVLFGVVTTPVSHTTTSKHNRSRYRW